MSEIKFKRAQTFGFTYRAERPFAYDPDPANWTITSHIRRDGHADYTELTIAKTGTADGHLGEFSFAVDGTVGASTTAAVTREWDTGRWRTDVRFQHTDGLVEYSATATIHVGERQTRVV